MVLKPPEEKTVLQRYLPIVDWLPKYRWGEWLRFDVLAALTVWALLIPEAMAYAGIAGVPHSHRHCVELPTRLLLDEPQR